MINLRPRKLSKRAFVFIDGSNFYFGMRNIVSEINKNFSLLSFDFKGFTEWLVKPNKLVETRYYIGAIKKEEDNPKSEKLYLDQQKLLSRLNSQGVIVRLGQLIRYSDMTYHEKGVDVKLAVEMIRYARQNKYDIAYLISSDTDLVDAIREVQSIGKKVIYIGFPKGQSFGLSQVADGVRILTSEDIREFLKEKKQSRDRFKKTKKVIKKIIPIKIIKRKK